MISVKGSITALILASVLLGANLRIDAQRAGTETLKLEVNQLPLELAGWSGSELPGLGIRAKHVLQLDQHLQRAYKNEIGRGVSLYIGYWERQTGDHQAAKHSPLVCLPANGWKISSRETTTLPAQLGGIEVNELVASRGAENYLFMYWFFRGDDTYTKEWRALIDISLGAFLYGRSDGGIIEVSLPVRAGGPNEARETAVSFLTQFLPEFNKLNR